MKDKHGLLSVLVLVFHVFFQSECFMFRCIRCFAIGLVFSLTVLLAASLEARAGISIWATNQATIAGGSGTFEVLLQNNTGSSIDVASFDTILEVASNSGLTFTGVDDTIPSLYSYIFGTVQNGPLGDTATPPTVAISDFLSTGFTTIGVGATVGLARISYTIDPTTPTGSIAITFSVDNQEEFLTNVYDPSYIPYTPLSITGGTISVTSVGAVPEPTSCIFFGGLAIAMLRRVSLQRSNRIIDAQVCS